MREWVSREDEFVLKQSKKKAQIRVREGRARPIDWLAVISGIIDPIKDLLDDDTVESELDIMNPIEVIEGLSHTQLLDLEKEIESFNVLESNHRNCTYWVVSFSKVSYWMYLLTVLGNENHLPGLPKSTYANRSFTKDC